LKKHLTIVAGAVLALLGALAVSLICTRPGVSMTLVGYGRWPHGAKLLLNNGTKGTIRYLAEPDITPAGSPVLCVQGTPTGWTNASLFESRMSIDPRTGKTVETFYTSGVGHDLKPGQSVEFFVRLEPDGFPKRVGTICFVQRGKLASKLYPGLARIRRWWQVKTPLPGQLEVWGSKTLRVSSAPDLAAGN